MESNATNSEKAVTQCEYAWTADVTEPKDIWLNSSSAFFNVGATSATLSPGVHCRSCGCQDLGNGIGSKVRTSRLETVSTVRGSGWVKRSYS